MNLVGIITHFIPVVIAIGKAAGKKSEGGKRITQGELAHILDLATGGALKALRAKGVDVEG